MTNTHIKDEWKNQIRGRHIKPTHGTNFEQAGCGLVVDSAGNAYVIKITKHENKPEPKFDKDSKEIPQPVEVSYSQEFVFNDLHIYSKEELEQIVEQINKYKNEKFI